MNFSKNKNMKYDQNISQKCGRGSFESVRGSNFNLSAFIVPEISTFLRTD